MNRYDCETCQQHPDTKSPEEWAAHEAWHQARAAVPSGKPFTLAFRIEDETPGHVTIGVFSGPGPGRRGKSGTLIFRVEEWPQAEAMLRAGGWEDARP
ncbi:MAG: hypothetical protein WC211_03805 [Dehalococcoidia bacterium]